MKKLPAAKACTQTDICENQWCYEVYKEIKDMIADASAKSKYSAAYDFDEEFTASARDKVRFLLRCEGYNLDGGNGYSLRIEWEHMRQYNSFRQYVLEQEGKI